MWEAWVEPRIWHLVARRHLGEQEPAGKGKANPVWTGVKWIWEGERRKPRVEAEVPGEEVLQSPAGGKRELEHSEEVLASSRGGEEGVEVLRGSCSAGAPTAAALGVKGSWTNGAPRSVCQGLAANPWNRGKNGLHPKSPLRREKGKEVLHGVPDVQ